MECAGEPAPRFSTSPWPKKSHPELRLRRVLDVLASRVYLVLRERGMLRSKSEARGLGHARRREAEEHQESYRIDTELK